VRPMTDYKLCVRFNTGEALFREVCIDYGMSVYESRWFACSQPELTLHGGMTMWNAMLLRSDSSGEGSNLKEQGFMLHSHQS